MRLSLALCPLAWMQAIQAQVQLLNITSVTAPSLSSTCITVLNQQVSCNSSLALIGGGAGLNAVHIYSNQYLAGLCSSTCASSLSTWLRRVSGACGSTAYMRLPDGSSGLPAYYAESFLEYYQQACLTGSGGNLCNAALGTLAGIDPDNQSITGTPVSTLACNSCYLSLISTQLEQPLASNPGLASLYTALTSSCHVTSMSVTPLTATTTWSIKSTTASSSASSATCSGSTYAVKSGDTCQSVSYQEQISTVSLLTANNLQAYCYEFPTSGTLCIPASQVCQPYMVQKNDTCTSIALAQTGISYAQILSWNAFLGPACGNIGQYVGYTICLSSPGGYSGPTAVTPPAISATSTIPDTVAWTPFSEFAAGSMPTVAANGSSPQPTALAPLASGARTDCALYVAAPVLVNATANLTSSSCAVVAASLDVSPVDFAAWNSLTYDPDNSNSSAACTLAAGYQYCAQTYVEQANATSYCDQFELPPPGYDDCELFVELYGLELDQFVAWNPQAGAGCANFTMDVEYCISVYGFRQPGIVSSCNKFVMPNDTNWADGPCTLIETEYGLSHARFVAWNPAVQQNCSGLYPGYDYCVSIPNYKPTYTTPSSSVTSTTAPATTG